MNLILFRGFQHLPSTNALSYSHSYPGAQCHQAANWTYLLNREIQDNHDRDASLEELPKYMCLGVYKKTQSPHRVNTRISGESGRLQGVGGRCFPWNRWGVCLWGPWYIRVLYSCRVQVSGGFGYPLNSSDRSKPEDHRGTIAIFILLINLDYVPLCMTPCVKQWRSGKQDRPILCPHWTHSEDRQTRKYDDCKGWGRRHMSAVYGDEGLKHN